MANKMFVNVIMKKLRKDYKLYIFNIKKRQIIKRLKLTKKLRFIKIKIFNFFLNNICF